MVVIFSPILVLYVVILISAGVMNFAIGYTEVAVVICMCGQFGYGLTTGGPPGLFWSWMLTFFMTMFVAFSMAEICSAFPKAGAVYNWAGNLELSRKNFLDGRPVILRHSQHLNFVVFPGQLVPKPWTPSGLTGQLASGTRRGPGRPAMPLLPPSRRPPPITPAPCAGVN